MGDGRSLLSLSDEQLVNNTLKNDKSAFGALVQKYERVVYAMVFQRLKHQDDALEVTQEVFMKSYNSLNTLRNPAIFKNWLFEIAVNQCQDALRRREKRIALSLDDPEVLKSASNSRSSTMTAEHHELYQVVLKAIDALPEIYQMPLMLHLMEEMDAKEIAERLGVASETVRKQIYRGIQLLRERLESLMNTDKQR